jgi:hypothetical protein
MNSPKTIHVLVRLKAAISDLRDKQKLGPSDYDRLCSQIDDLLVSRIGELPDISLEALVHEARAAELGLDLSPLDFAIAGDAVRNLREVAAREGSDVVDLSATFPDGWVVPARSYNWEDTIEQWRKCALSLEDPSVDFSVVVDACQTFFETQTSVNLPTGFPAPFRDILTGLYEDPISAQEMRPLRRDQEAVRLLLGRLEPEFTQRLSTDEINTQDAGRNSDHIFNAVLQQLKGTRAGRYSKSVERIVSQWRGPAFAELAKTAWNVKPENRESQDRMVLLILARTGIDPRDAAEWIRWVRNQHELEHVGREHFSRIATKNILYDLAFMLATASFSGDDALSRWQGVREQMIRPRPQHETATTHEHRTPETTRSTSPQAVPSPTTADATAAAAGAAQPVRLPDRILPASMTTDSAEALAAPRPVVSAEDAVVKSHSTWNRYLRPFLMENWLALIGIASMVIAWLFLSLWLWDKGETYRVLAGSVPLLGLTVGTSWIARFISRIEDASRPVVGLFAVVGFLLLPFNFVLDVSILESSQSSGITFGVGLAIFLAAALLPIGRMLAPGFGASPVLFICLLYAPIYLVPIAAAALGPSTRRSAVEVLPFLGFLALMASLRRLQRRESIPFRLTWMLYGGAYILLNLVLRIYYRMPPEFASVALLLELAAFAVAYFGATLPTAVSVGGGLSFLGLLVALNVPPWLPAVVVLAGGFWIYVRTRIQAHWRDDIVVLHLSAVVLSPLYGWAAPAAAWPFVILAALLVSAGWERFSGHTTAVDYACLIYPILSYACYRLWAQDLPIWSLVPLLLAIAVGAYSRYAGRELTVFWYLNFVAAGIWAFPGTWTARFRGEEDLVLYFAATSLLWASLSPLLRDKIAVAQSNRLLWGVSFVGVALVWDVVMGGSGRWDPSIPAGTLFLIVALVIAARRTGSALPAYVGLGISVLVGEWALTRLRLEVRVGLLTATLGLMAFGIATLLDRWKFEIVSESRGFPLERKRYLREPLEVAGFLAALAGSMRAWLAIQPASQTLRPAAALLFATVGLCWGAERARSRHLSYLHFLPLAGLAWCVLLSLPLALRPHGCLLLAVLLLLAREWIHRRYPELQIASLWWEAEPVVLVASVIASYGGYLIIFTAGGGLVSSLFYPVLAVAFCHYFVVRRFKDFHQLVLGHAALAIAITWGFQFLIQQQWQEWLRDPLPVLAILGGAFFFPAYFGEVSSRPGLREYARGAQGWILACAVLYLLGFCLSVFFSGRSSVVFALAGWLLFQAGNRNWQLPIAALAKAAYCFRAAQLLAGDPLLGLLAGSLVFFLLERAVEASDGGLKTRFRATPFVTPRPQGEYEAIVLHIFLFGSLITHACLFYGLFGYRGPSHDGVLYGLVALALLIHRRYGAKYLAYWIPGVFAYANLFQAAKLLPYLQAYQISLLQVSALACLGSIAVFASLQRWTQRVGDLADALQKWAVALGVLVIGLLCVNFLVAHQIGEATRLRFVFSASVLGCTALYFRFLIAAALPLHRAAYRIAVTMMFWSLGYAVFPYPETFLYLALVPAFVFLIAVEIKSTRGREIRADVAAAGLLFALVLTGYAEQQPIRILLFPGSDFDWDVYYAQAPILLLCAIGLARLGRWSDWKGLGLTGVLVFLGGLELLVSRAAHSYVSFPVRIEVLSGVILIHLFMTVFLGKSRLASAYFRFCGLDQSREAIFRTILYVICNILLVLALPAILIEGRGAPETIALAALCVLGGLCRFRPQSTGVVLASLGLLMFPLGWLCYPTIKPEVWSLGLALLVLITTMLRRSLSWRAAVPDAVYVFIALVYVASLIGPGFFAPRQLVFLGILAASWLALPDRPGNVPARRHYLLWPPVTAIVLLCLTRGNTGGVLSLWAAGCVLPPLAVLTILLSLAHSSTVRLPVWARDWVESAPRALPVLSFWSLVIAVLAFVVDYARIAAGTQDLAFIVAVLVAGAGIHFWRTLQSTALAPAVTLEIHIWLLLALLRWKAVMVGALEMATPLDSYLFMGASMVASGIREIVHRRAPHLESHLFQVSLLYGLAGWGYALWLKSVTGAGWHAELNSIFLSALFYWFALRRERINLIPAFLFGNVASVLLLHRLEWRDPQFYIVPGAGSVLALSQAFRTELGAEKLKAIRLWCGLVVLATSSLYDVLSFDVSHWYAVAAVLLSALGVVVGIALEVRVYLYLGTCFFLLNSAAIAVNVIRSQSPESEKLLLGVLFLGLGIFFTGSFLLFQMKRQEILREYTRLRVELRTWE